MLTGGNQHVGNWPGKTVEKKEGTVVAGGETIHVYDLPGTYSLTANSLEEMITLDFLIHELPDVVVVVVDTGQLERSMYMLAEVVPLGIPMIVALNKMDMAENQGYEINPGVFKQKTGFAVIPMTASKSEGIAALLEAVAKIESAEPSSIKRIALPGEDLPQYNDVLEIVQDNRPSGFSGPWLASKLLEGDAGAATMMAEHLSPEAWAKLRAILPRPEKGQMTMATSRYDWVKHMLPGLVAGSPGHYKRNGFDVAATHPIWGKLIAVAVLLVGMIAAYLLSIPLMIPGFAFFFLADPLSRPSPGLPRHGSAP
ncbi:hypothetical protein DSCO28_60030 [Desulfosarcina ovata subsp. sediminis]|uniref:FeoB-type G domain-containing protein n=2 Tax=Desulfosarcina ovata TaxID=83564 RepID=A0A5K7ZYT9_9BACT|nr:hypothetical protein DSCO28_60030 [Desulfosarcina ovata subsp. sediminis]